MGLQDLHDRLVTRRRLLRLGLGLAAMPLLAACAPAAAPTPTPAPPKPTAPPAASPAASPVGSPAPKPAASPAAGTQAAPAAKVAPLSPSVKVTVGMIGSTSDAGFYLAEERGYFKDEGIEFEIIPFQTGADMVPAAGTGQLDVATGATSAGLFNAIARDIPLKIVADKGANRSGFQYTSLIVRKDLVDSGQVREYGDLKGRKVGVAGQGNTGSINIDRAMKRSGLTLKDVDLTILGYADMGTAFANKALDAGIAIEPFRTQWQEQGVGARLPDDAEVYPNNQAAVVMYGPQFPQTKGEAANRLIVAYLRGVRDYNDAFVKNQGRDAVIEVLIKRTPLKDRALYDKMGLPALNPDGAVLFEDLDSQQKWYVEYGHQARAVDMKTVVDTQYVDFAVARLGKYS